MAIQAIVVLSLLYIIALVFRNRNILMIRPSRHTRSYEGEQLEDFIRKLHEEGKSLEEISAVSGSSIEDIKKILNIT